MFVRAYLRASTQDQDATRARATLEAFAEERGLTVAAWYVENESWASLKGEISARGVRIVVLDLPTSWECMTSTDETTARILAAVNGVLLDMLAAIARKDYTDRRRRQV